MIERLRSELGSTVPLERARAAQSLADSASELSEDDRCSALVMLGERLADEDLRVRAEVLLAIRALLSGLGEIRKAGDLVAVLRVPLLAGDARAQNAAAGILARVRDLASAISLTAFLGSPARSVRRAAAEALVAMGWDPIDPEDRAAIESAVRGQSAGDDSNLDERLRNAVAEQETDLVEILVRAGADPAAEDAEGRTALIFALDTASCETRLLRSLLKTGGRAVNLRDRRGETALHLAVRRNHTSGVSMLIDAGADRNLRDAEGLTPRDRAERSGIRRRIRGLLDREPRDPPVRVDELERIVAEHRVFIAEGGGGGKWEPSGSTWRYSGALSPPAGLAGKRLEGHDLRGIDLRWADLRSVRCRGQDLSGANLAGSLLTGGDLAGTRFRGARLAGVNFTGAVLAGCDFRDAELEGAAFTEADLTRARIDWACVGRERWRIIHHESAPTGELGEIERNFSYRVVDQRTGDTIAWFEGSSYWSAFGSFSSETGVSQVRLSDSGTQIVATFADGREERLDLPA